MAKTYDEVPPHETTGQTFLIPVSTHEQLKRLRKIARECGVHLRLNEVVSTTLERWIKVAGPELDELYMRTQAKRAARQAELERQASEKARKVPAAETIQMRADAAIEGSGTD